MGTSRHFGTVTKLPSGRYRARYTHLGKQVDGPKPFATKSEARAWLSMVQADLQRGDYFDPRAGAIPFGEYAAEWLENRRLRGHTRETYNSQMVRILDWFERVELRAITPAEVRRWHGQLINSELSPNTVAKIYRLFRTICSTAVEDGLLRSNPVSIRGASHERTIERPLLSWSDVTALATHIHPQFSAFVWTAATSGLRFGELTGLTRRHISVPNRTIKVDQSLGYINGKGPVIGPPKSDAAYRRVSLPSTALELLRAHLDAYVDDRPDAFVFTTPTGRPLLNGYFRPHWTKAKAAAGVDQSVRFHDLRHLAGTTAASAGASLREIMARMGHASSAAALRYLKASEQRDAEIVVAIDDRLNRQLYGVIIGE